MLGINRFTCLLLSLYVDQLFKEHLAQHPTGAQHWHHPVVIGFCFLLLLLPADLPSAQPLSNSRPAPESSAPDPFFSFFFSPLTPYFPNRLAKIGKFLFYANIRNTFLEKVFQNLLFSLLAM